MKTVKIFLGSVNVSPTMPKGGTTAILIREYSLSEFIDKVRKQQEEGIEVENFITDDDLSRLLVEKGLNLPERDQDQSVFSIPAWCVYYKICRDRNGKVIINRWNYYPREEVIIRTELED